MHLTITGYSTALFSTWYFIDELGLLFDAGDGVTSALLQKSRKINHVFISHADRDHITGLLQFNQLNARPGLPHIYYPKDSGSFPPLEAFSKKFDPHVSGSIWKGLDNGEHIAIKDGIYVEAIRNGHVRAANDVIKSLGYLVYEVRNKIKPEFEQLSQQEIVQIVNEFDREHITEQIKRNVLGFSADTPAGDMQKWNDTDVLIHEATFLYARELNNEDTRRNLHSSLEEVLQNIPNLNIGSLILGHFSSRYKAHEIDDTIKQMCQQHEITIPVYRVLPGEIHRDILNGQRIW